MPKPASLYGVDTGFARQFVEQMPRADVDKLNGIAPTVAIEQRVTKGTRKSTVATITEVAQYLRLLYARIGIQHLHIGCRCHTKFRSTYCAPKKLS